MGYVKTWSKGLIGVPELFLVCLVERFVGNICFIDRLAI